VGTGIETKGSLLSSLQTNMVNTKVNITIESIWLRKTQTPGLPRQHEQFVQIFVVLCLKKLPSQLLNKQPP
jgi:hypothetical protein